MVKPSPAELLRHIATEEPLERTLRRFPSVSEAELRTLLDAVAQAAATREASILPPGAPASPSRASTPAAPSEPSTARGSAAAPGSATASRPAAQEAAPRKVSPHPALRIYSDGAARGNPGPAGAGAVLMTPSGEIVERLGKYLGKNTNNYAEYMGLILGLRRAHELGASAVEVFADSELMVRQLQGLYKVKAPNLVPLFAEAKALLGRFSKVKVSHVRRELNLEADEMSNRAIDERM